MSGTPADCSNTQPRRTKRPAEPESSYEPQTRSDGEEVPIGNPEYVEMLKMTGQLGCFYDRDQTTRIPTAVTVNNLVFRECAVLTLTRALENLLSRDTRERLAESTYQNVGTVAHELANGIAVALYLKLRSLNLFEVDVMERFYPKPMAPNPFEIPAAYELAIHTLGQIKVKGMPREEFYTPVCSVEAADNFCLPDGIIWSPYAYVCAVDYAKRIGMQFNTMELQVKRGTAWWLLQPVVASDHFELRCPIPGENFTDETALVRALFCVNAAGGFYTDLVDLDPLQNRNFGSMFRNPTPRIDLDVFNGIRLRPVSCGEQ